MSNKIEKSKFPNIIFGFNKDWELKNWVDSCLKKITYSANNTQKWDIGGIPPEVETIVKENKQEKDALIEMGRVFNRFLKVPSTLHIMNEATKRAKKRWNEVAEKCILGISKMLNIPVEEFEQNYYAFFTFGKRIPFSKNKFMFNQFSDFINTASHEIMHIEFLKKYNEYCLNKGLSQLQISHLKEILTVLLNEDLGDLLYRSDHGYESHKKIRQEVLSLYKTHKKTNKNFTIFLDKAIILLKKEWNNLIQTRTICSTLAHDEIHR